MICVVVTQAGAEFDVGQVCHVDPFEHLAVEVVGFKRSNRHTRGVSSEMVPIPISDAQAELIGIDVAELIALADFKARCVVRQRISVAGV